MSFLQTENITVDPFVLMVDDGTNSCRTKYFSPEILSILKSKFIINLEPMLAKTKILFANRQAFACVAILVFLLLLTSFANTVAAHSLLDTAPGQSFWLWNLLGRLHPLAVHF